MWVRLLSVSPYAWSLLGLLLVLAVFSTVSRATGAIAAPVVTYVVYPLALSVLAGLAHLWGRGRRDRIRKKNDKILLVLSIVAVWFVVYFLSGLLVTFGKNVLVSDLRGVLLNIVAFGGSAVALEYTRHKLLLLAGERNVRWFGVLMTLIGGLLMTNVAQLTSVASLEDAIKVIVADIAPAFAASALLTYLSLTSGFGAQLAYRLGVVSIAILPPILPKYDWYMLGVSAILLVLAVYLFVDRMIVAQARSEPRRSHHPKRAYDVMFVLVMIGLVLFMTGFFSYKPIAIVSNSMHPLFSRGSMVVVQRVGDPLDIGVGDIVQYEASGKMITHRVQDIATDDEGNRVFITKGDNSPSKDPPVSQKQVVGVVKSNIPYIGYPTVWLKELAR